MENNIKKTAIQEMKNKNKNELLYSLAILTYMIILVIGLILVSFK